MIEQTRQRIADAIRPTPPPYMLRIGSRPEPDVETRSWAPLINAFGSINTAAGQNVTAENSLQNSAVLACVRVLAESVAVLPLHVFERLGPKRKVKAHAYYLYDLLHTAPNSTQSAFEFRELLQSHLLLYGNAYARIHADGRGRIFELEPLHAGRMLRPRWVDGVLYYPFMPPSGKIELFRQDQIFHLRGLSGDGLIGYSPITLARQAIGLANAAELYGARFFANDARPGGVIVHPDKLKKDDVLRLKSDWGQYRSAENAHKTAVLHGGASFVPITVPMQDAQFIEARKFQLADIARIYRIPPHLINDLEHATFSNIEHQSQEFLQYSLMPWLERWEQAISLQLMLKRERERYFPKFQLDAFLRADTLTRYNSYQTGINAGFLSRNEARELEDRDPLPGLDKPLIPLNMAEIGTSATESKRGSAADRQDTEARSLAFAERRQWIAGTYQNLLADALGRVLRREANDIKNKLPKMDDRAAELDAFYAEFGTWVIGYLWPAYESLGEHAARAAAEEIDGDVDDLEDWIRAYLEFYTARHIGKSRTQLENAFDSDDPDAAVEETLTAWREERPTAVAFSESVRFGNAIAMTVWAANSIARKVWRTSGSDTCPYCRNLDGKIVGIDANFINAGQTYKPKGADRPLTPKGNIKHGPAHNGCDCTISPVK